MFISTLLKSFMVTAKNNSMKNGAKKLFITESPLSRRIRNLEEQLGYRVFIRSRDGVTLTKEGLDIYNAILPYYEELVFLESHFIHKHKSQKKLSSISIGLNISIEYNTLDLLSNFIYSNPDEINKLSYGFFNDDITSLLLSDDIDIIISSNELTYNNDVITRIPIQLECIYLAQSKNVNLQEKKSLIISSSLYNILDKKNNNWKPWLMTALGSKNEINVIIIPEVINHLFLIEEGDVVGLIPSSMIKLISDKFEDIIIHPFLINNSTVSMDLNAYLEKEKSEIIIERIISKL